jgi:phosphomannomutase
VLDQLESLYRQHGLFLTGQRGIALTPGATPLGDLLRETPPAQIADSLVVQIDDLRNGSRRYADGRVETIDFPQSDVLIYSLANKARVIVRPSGTEPKVKCYYEVVEDIPRDAPFNAAMQQAQSSLASLADAHQKSVAALLDKSA